MKIDYQNPSVTLTSPFGESAQVKAMEGTEEISGLFRFDLTLASDDHDLDFSKIIGKGVEVALKLVDESERMIHGICTHIAHAGLSDDAALYHAVLRPWLWQLTIASDCRIYQNKSTPEIMEELFKELGFSDYSKKLKGQYGKREYCVQYMETCFDFVSRLMEEEGIYYFFSHEKGKHTMVLADDPSAHTKCTGSDTVKFRPSPDRAGRYNSVPRCVFREAMTTGGFAVNDFNFESPKDKMLAEASGKGSDMKQYSYPGNYMAKGDGDGRAKIWQQACEQPGEELSGSSFAPGFSSGTTFTMEEHPRKALNQVYMLKVVQHKLTQQQYSNSFTAIPESRPYRPLMTTRKTRIYGAQTAMVVGKSGEEIWTDKYGRIKVQFHWDREGKKDENSSCWVRVSQSWAGKKWGAFFLPRIGQEVLVTCLEGDPDRPMVTGCVYNGDFTVPYALPANQTQSTMKSNSSKGGAGFNEIRFEDKKDSEEFFMHAQKDMNVEILNDNTINVGNERVTTIKEANETLTVAKGDRLVEVSKGDETHTNGANFTHQVKGDYTCEVKGNYTLKVTGNLTIEAKGKINITASQDYTAESKMNVTNKAGINFKNEAAVNMDNKAGAMVTVKGALVKIN